MLLNPNELCQLNKDVYIYVSLCIYLYWLHVKTGTVKSGTVEIGRSLNGDDEIAGVGERESETQTPNLNRNPNTNPNPLLLTCPFHLLPLPLHYPSLHSLPLTLAYVTHQFWLLRFWPSCFWPSRFRLSRFWPSWFWLSRFWRDTRVSRFWLSRFWPSWCCLSRFWRDTVYICQSTSLEWL